MTTREQAAGQIIVGGTFGTDLSPQTTRRLEQGRLGGLILMGRNVDSPGQVRGMLGAAAAAAAPGEPPPLLAVDQEGGRVARLRRGVLALPPARTLGRIDDLDLTRSAAQVLGQQLRALGFTLDFTPVLDLDDGPAGQVIGDRSFSGAPQAAARQGVAVIEGMIAAGLCPCGKHFPGHGATSLDSHSELPLASRDLEQLEARELIPFAAGFAAGLPLLMPAHVVYEGIDPERPATFSPALLVDLLRQRLGYQGAVISDDLMMGAVAQAGGLVEVAVEALVAGVDLLLICNDEEAQEQVLEAVADAARRSPATAVRLEQAASRAHDLRARFTPSPAPIEALDAALDSETSRHVGQLLEQHIGNT